MPGWAFQLLILLLFAVRTLWNPLAPSSPELLDVSVGSVVEELRLVRANLPASQQGPVDGILPQRMEDLDGVWKAAEDWKLALRHRKVPSTSRFLAISGHLSLNEQHYNAFGLLLSNGTSFITAFQGPSIPSALLALPNVGNSSEVMLDWLMNRAISRMETSGNETTMEKGMRAWLHLPYTF